MSWSAWGPGRIVLVLAAVGLVLVAVGYLVVHPMVQPRLALAFGILITLGELARLAMPGDRETAPIGMAGALGYTLLLDVGGTTRATHGALQIVVVVAVAMVVGALPHITVGRAPRLDGLARRLLTIAVAAFAFRPVAAHLTVRGQWWIPLVLMVGIVVFASVVEAVLAALLRAEALRARFGVALADEARAQARLDAAVGATAVLLAMATAMMGLSALIVFIAPLLVTQIAFRRYAGIRATYLQTVRALSRVTEVGGYVESGHSHRVSTLSVAVGRELGLNESELLDLEYAALMHDIGQLSLPEPIPGGATVLASGEEQRRIARLGAEVIRQAGVLDQVAEMVERQSEPYGPDRTVPLASRIIRVANAYDDLVGPSGDRGRAAAALERLRQEVATEYDPDVVEALAHIVNRIDGGRL